jgi:opacity protein-like surface antigen
MGGGFNFPVGEADDYLNSSGSFFLGGGRHLNQNNTIQIEWTHNWLSIDPDVFDAIETDTTSYNNAYASSWSVTLNLMHRLNPDNDIVPWLTGGIGYYKRNIQITENALVYYPPIWDPWWGWIDGGWAPGEAITGNRESSGFGFNVGLGVDFEIESGASLFLDVRYHRAYLEGVDVTLIPVMAGVRW